MAAHLRPAKPPRTCHLRAGLNTVIIDEVEVRVSSCGVLPSQPEAAEVKRRFDEELSGMCRCCVDDPFGKWTELAEHAPLEQLPRR